MEILDEQMILKYMNIQNSHWQDEILHVIIIVRVLLIFMHLKSSKQQVT